MLPGPGRVPLIVDEACEAGRHRPLIAGGPEPHIDLVERAFSGLRRKRRDQPLGEAHIVLAAREALGAFRLRPSPAKS